MNPHITGRRLFSVVIALCLVAVLVSLPYAHQISLAQEGETQISYGQNVPGQITAGGTAVFFFDAQANDVADIQVLAFGFSPIIQIQDQGKTQVLAANQNPENATTIELTYTTVNAGRHYIVVGGVDGGQAGQFGLSLAKGTRELPPGTPLAVEQTLQGTVDNPDVPAVYDFATSPDSVLSINIRSLTGGYNPKAVVQTENGEVVGSLGNPRLIGFCLSFAPGGENLKLVVERGTFEGSATFEVSLSASGCGGTGSSAPVATQQPSDGGTSGGGSNSGPDYGVGLSSAPSSGCYLSVTGRTNIRSGGSTSHDIVAVLGPDGYLVVTGYNNANGKWYQVSIPDGRIGWMSSTVVSTFGSCNFSSETSYPGSGGSSASHTPSPTFNGTITATPTFNGTVTATPTSNGNPTHTPTPSYTPTDTVQTAPPDSDYFTSVNIKGGSVTLNGVISYPNGDTVDKIFYDVTGFDSVTTSGDVQAVMTCSGTGVEHVRINFNNVGSIGSTNCPGNVTKFHTNDSDQGFIRIDLTGGSNSYVNWTLTLTGLE